MTVIATSPTLGDIATVCNAKSHKSHKSHKSATSTWMKLCLFQRFGRKNNHFAYLYLIEESVASS